MVVLPKFMGVGCEDTQQPQRGCSEWVLASAPSKLQTAPSPRR